MTNAQSKPSNSSLLQSAWRYLDQGLSLLPINLAAKKPYCDWKSLQNTPASHDTVEQWLEKWPDAGIGIITGVLSGLLVVDADTPEAVRWC